MTENANTLLKRKIQLLFQAIKLTAKTTGTNCTKASAVLTSEHICRIKANTISLMEINPAASVMKNSMFFKSGFTSYVRESCLLRSPLPFFTASPTQHLPISDGCRAPAKPTPTDPPRPLSSRWHQGKNPSHYSLIIGYSHLEVYKLRRVKQEREVWRPLTLEGRSKQVSRLDLY